LVRDKARQQAAQKRHRQKNFAKFIEYLQSHPCVDCGETDIRVLQFDHLPQFEKKFEIGRAITGSTRKWEVILEEINKCEVVCANDHLRRTGSRAGWRKHLINAGEYEAPEVEDSPRKFRVPHGGGVRGRRGCKCTPCKVKNAMYSRSFQEKKKWTKTK